MVKAWARLSVTIETKNMFEARKMELTLNGKSPTDDELVRSLLISRDVKRPVAVDLLVMAIGMINSDHSYNDQEGIANLVRHLSKDEWKKIIIENNPFMATK